MDSEHFDVLIVGAGISDVGGAYHLRQQCRGKSFVVLEAREDFGGTWRTHRFPGIRSDSDLYTFGYRFKPWTGAPIATAEKILAYMGEVIDENGLARHIRYRHRISSASWSSEDGRWTIEAQRTDSGERARFTASFLWMCQGYYHASWTLRADLIADFVCRLLGHMEQGGAAVVVPALRPEDQDMPRLPWVESENFNPGYVMRGVDLLPKQGDRMPWRHTQDYWRDKDDLPAADLEDGALVYHALRVPVGIDQSDGGGADG